MVPEEQTVPPARPTSRAVLVLGIVAAVIVVGDVVSKYLVVAHLSHHAPVRLLGGAVYLTLTRNSGAAFSLGTGVTWVFPVVSVLVMGWIGWMAPRLRSIPWAVALGLILGGALGNLIDRLRFGQVVDFLDFHAAGWHWPAFNVADSAITVGAVLLILEGFVNREGRARASP